MSGPSVADVLSAALDALGPLEVRAAEIPDEALYVEDLIAAWRARLSAVATARGAEPAPAGAAMAVGELAREASTISDPNRAIDWLSTLPQLTLAIVGETG
jgi:hypothetical protein